MGNTFGQLFRVTTFGESHGGGIGVVIDGCPPKIDISEADIQRKLDRRRPGQSKITTQRQEEDRCEILSGIFEGKTLGTPIGILVRNKDARPQDYAAIKEKFRPSHADFTYEAKYGIRNWQGGGRASARETIGRVAAAVVARKVLRSFYPKIDIVAYVTQIHELATKGFEIGSGFAATRMRGSEHNDPFEMRAGKIRTSTNYSGGIQGGISNGEEIYFRVAFKPTATIAREQKTVSASREQTKLAARGRHDPCVLPRAVPMVEAMAALVLCDHALRQRAIGPSNE